jgi:hypothetical protein
MDSVVFSCKCSLGNNKPDKSISIGMGFSSTCKRDTQDNNTCYVRIPGERDGMYSISGMGSEDISCSDETAKDMEARPDLALREGVLNGVLNLSCDPFLQKHA